MIKRGKNILNLLGRTLPTINFNNMEILEIGCSAGGILVPFLEAGSIVKGFDYDQRYLDYGNKYNKSLNLCIGGFENLKDENKNYDLIIMNHVLEHWTAPL